jgi:hypothetical protein
MHGRAGPPYRDQLEPAGRQAERHRAARPGTLPRYAAESIRRADHIDQVADAVRKPSRDGRDDNKGDHVIGKISVPHQEQVGPLLYLPVRS